MRMIIVSAFAISCALAQQAPTPATTADHPKTEQRKGPGAAKDIGSGAGNIGTGAAKGAGDAAKGVGKGAVDLVTLHPINAAEAVGKGAASTGRDVTVGTAKGTGKIARGIGKAFKKLF
jgi:hypothetical protein